ncbi:MAG: hypothetical protein AAF547_20405 [Actinomycetota bacterium]
MTIYEVFLKRDGLAEFRHVGSIEAATDELASVLARECYLRRSEGDRLWLVRRSDVIDPDDGVLFLPATRARRLLDGWDDPPVATAPMPDRLDPDRPDPGRSDHAGRSDDAGDRDQASVGAED